MSTEERHRKMRAALKTLQEILNEDSDVRIDVTLLVTTPGSTSSDYGSTIHDRRHALAMLRERVRVFEEQLGEAA